MDENVTKLNKREMRLLYTTSKYMSLLSLAVFTTWMSWILILLYVRYLPLNGDIDDKVICVVKNKRNGMNMYLIQFSLFC